MNGIEITCVDVGNIRIYIPDERASIQHQVEIGLFLYGNTDDFYKDNCRDIYADVGNTSNYQLFVSMWTMFKYGFRYKHSKAFQGLDLWNMKIKVQQDKSIVFVDSKGKVVLDKQLYNAMSKAVRDECIKRNLI